MGKDGKITTGVDGLIDLLSSGSKISLPDAAKKLGIPQSTVETWVDFLVEEKKVAVEYKFTTPYLSLIKDENSSDDELKISHDDLEEEIGSEFSPNKSQEDSVPQIPNPSEDGNIQGDLSSSLDRIEGLISQGKIDEAYSDYMKWKDYAENNASEEETKRFISINDSFVAKLEEIKKDSQERLSEVDRLVEESKHHISKGDMDSARVAYEKMVNLYETIPSLFGQEKGAAYDRISYVYRVADHAYNMHSLKVAEDAENRIKDMKPTIVQLMKQGKLDEAKEHYESLQRLYESIPDNIVAEKLRVYNLIIRLHREMVLARRFQDLRSELHGMGSDLRLSHSHDDNDNIKEDSYPERVNDERGQHGMRIDATPQNQNEDPKTSSAQETMRDNRGDILTSFSDQDSPQNTLGTQSDDFQSTQSIGHSSNQIKDSRYGEKEYSSSSGFENGNRYDDATSGQIMDSQQTGSENPEDTVRGDDSADKESDFSDTAAQGPDESSRSISSPGLDVPPPKKKTEKKKDESSLSSSNSYLEKAPDVLAPSVEKEPENPELIFGDEDPDYTEHIPTNTAFDESLGKRISDADNEEYYENDVQEDADDIPDKIVESFSDQSEDESYSTANIPRLFDRSYLKEAVQDDTDLRDAIDAFNSKDYTTAKKIVDKRCKKDPSDGKAKQLKTILDGMLSDSNGAFYMEVSKGAMKG